jgi:hypothetical protein
MDGIMEGVSRRGLKAYSARLVYIWVYKDLAIDRRGTLWKILKKGRASGPI